MTWLHEHAQVLTLMVTVCFFLTYLKDVTDGD